MECLIPGAEFEVTINFLPSFGAKCSTEMLLSGPRSGLVNFALLMKESPWLSPDSQKGLSLPQRSRTIDIEVVVHSII